MKIIEKYIIKEIARLFFIVLAAVVGIYLMVDFFEKIDNFISAGLDPFKAVLFFIYKIPLVFTQVLPLALLIAVLVALGLMSRNNEIVALKSSGVSMNFLLKPIIVLGLLSTGVLFVLSEIIVPVSVPKANGIWVKDVKKKQMVTTKEKNIWIRGNDRLVHIKYYNPVSGEFFGLSLYYFDEAFNLVRRIDATYGTYHQGKWIFHNVMEQVKNPGNGTFKTRLYEKKEEPLDLVPEDLQHVSKKSEEMGFSELKDYIKKTEMEGFDAMPFRVDLYAKTAFPFVCVILSLLGTGIGLKRSIREGLPVGIAYGIGIAFLYWMFHSFCLSLGYGGLLPPIVSAWMTNLVFLCWGSYIFLTSAFEG
jgi:lipopolysaccharide export system permease protein